jgi:hypothetical protein
MLHPECAGHRPGSLAGGHDKERRSGKVKRAARQGGAHEMARLDGIDRAAKDAEQVGAKPRKAIVQ